MNVPFYKHDIDRADIERVEEVLQGDFLTTGNVVREFQEKFARYFNIKNCLGTTSWTDSAEITLASWGIGDGDEVIVPTMSYIATAHCVERVGAKPVFVDSEAATGLIDVDQIQGAVSSRTKAIIPVHLYGVMPDMKKVREVADQYDLKILEDAAHAVGETERDGIRPGELGDSANFSFYATKNITCGEGGAIITNDDSLFKKALLRTRVGTSKSASDRSRDNRYQHYDSVVIAGKCNMTNISAALLLGQLERIQESQEIRRQLYECYQQRFEDVSWVELPEIPEGAKSSYHIFPIKVPLGVREDIFELLADHHIGCAVNFRPIHLMQIYREKYGYHEGMFPVAEEFGERCVTLPFYQSLTEQQINYIVDCFKNA